MRQKARLVDLLSFTRDGEWGNGEPSEGHSPALVVRGTDFSQVRAGNLATLPLRYIRSDVLARKAIVAGDTLIETAGGTKDQPTGRSVFIPSSIVASAKLPLICASFSRFLRPDSSRVDPQFLFWKLQDEYESRRMFPYHVQHTGVARFQYTQFAESYLLALPSLSEQRAIASTLGALDDKIELNRRMNETLEAMARAIFKDWFVDFGPTRAKMAIRGEAPRTARDKGEAPQREVVDRAPYLAPDIWSLFPDRLDEEGKPEGWNGYSLDMLATQHSATIAPSDAPDEVFEHFSLPAYDAGRTPSDDRGDTIKSSKTRVPKGAILLSKLNPEIERVWLPESPNGRSQVCSTEFLVFTPKANSNRPLLFGLFTDRSFRTMLQSMVTGTSKSHQRISSSALLSREVLVGLPPLFVRYGEQVGSLLARVLANRAESRTLAATRDLLLPKLMSGEIRIKDAERLVGEVA